MKTIAILGCGWLGLSLGEYLVGQGYRVKGSTTRVEKLAQLMAVGIEAHHLTIGDTIVGTDTDDFFRCDVLVLNIPPGRRQPDVETRYPQQVRLVAEAARAAGCRHLLFVSSTGVYPAERQIQVRTFPTGPTTASGRALVESENYLRGSSDWSTTVLRLAGLIGGQRQPGRWFAGRQDLLGARVPVNLVHREDCIQAIVAIVEQEKWGEEYHLCATEHPLKSDYYPEMARNLGLVPPSYAEGLEMPPYKVIDNSQILADLGLVLRFPDPRLI